MPYRTRIKKKITNSLPARIVIDQSKKIFIPGLQGHSLFELWNPFYVQLKKTNMIERASGISFNIVMAIPPTLIFIFTLLPYLPISDQFLNEIYHLIRDIIPGERNNSAIITFLQDFLDRPRNELLSFGLLLAIWFSSSAMMGVLRAFDKNYPGFSKRKMLNKRKVAIQLTLIVFFLVFICILLLIAQSHVLEWLGVENKTWIIIIDNSRWIFLVALVFYTVSFIYRHGPPMAQRWKFVTAGAVFATILMVLSTILFTWWVNHFGNYNKIYGSISAIFILMSLIYVNSLAVLLGFELNVTLDFLKRDRVSPSSFNGK